MTAVIVQIRDFHLRRLEKKAAEIKGRLIEFAKQGAPIVDTSPCEMTLYHTDGDCA